MTELEERTRQALERARAQHDPSTADAARVRAALSARLLAEPLLLETPSSTPAVPARAHGLPGKLMLLLAAGGAAGFAAGFLSARMLAPAPLIGAPSAPISVPVISSAAPPPVPIPPPATEEAPAAPAVAIPAAATPAAATPAALSAPASRSPQKTAARVPSRATDSRSTPSQLQAELDGLRRAQELLHRGQAAWAIARLDELDGAKVGSVLEEERSATRSLAECQLGRDNAARVSDFARRFPDSAHLEQVRTSCAENHLPEPATRNRPPAQTEAPGSPHQ